MRNEAKDILLDRGVDEASPEWSLGGNPADLK